jgi:restriction endonuclease S subunit
MVLMMNEFKLSDGIDKDKIFFVNLSKLEGRIDPNFYTQKYIHLVNKIKSRKYYKLKDVSESFKNGSTPKGGKFLTKGVLYYRSQNFDLFNLKKNTFISNEFNKKIDRSHCKINDIMLAVVGATLGKIGFINFYEDEGNINQNVARIRIKSNFFISKFIAIYLWLDIGQLLIKRNATITAQPYLNNEELGKILIPSICLNIQQDIINMVGKAYLSKQQKEKQAKDLLDSIDIYLLNELGITLPKIDNSLEKRIFKVNLNEVSSGRFDCNYCSPKYIEILKVINNSKYKIVELKDISMYVFQGIGQNLTKISNNIFLKVKNILNNNEIDFSNTELITEIPVNKILKVNDIVTPFIGEAIKKYKFSVFMKKSNKLNYCVDNNTGVIRLKKQVNAIYVSAFLMSSTGKELINQLIGGGGVPFLGANNAKFLKIPLPPIEKQNEMAEHIQKIRDTAKQLKTEAVQDLKNAKLEVEKMILGQ